jgi:outer membrane protein W
MLPLILAMAVTPATAEPKATAPVQIAQAVVAEAAPAAPTSFPYASLRVGIGFPQDYQGTLDIDDIDADTTLDLNTGFNGELALGYQFNRVRAELAVGYGNYGVDNQNFDVGEFGSFDADGDGAVNLTTVMLNGYYDIPIRNGNGSLSRWSPYIGAGVGYANISTPACSTDGCFSGGSTGGFAYQGKAGISYRATQQGYAFVEGGYLGAAGGDIDSVDFDNFGTWQVSIGWRQGFGGAPKAKPVAVVEEAPAPAPEPTPEPMPGAQPVPIRGLW